MSTGLFPPGTAHHGPPSEKRLTAYHQRRRVIRERRMDSLADLIADGWSIAAAARHLGFSQQSGSAMFREICERLGAQAS